MRGVCGITTLSSSFELIPSAASSLFRLSSITVNSTRQLRRETRLLYVNSIRMPRTKPFVTSLLNRFFSSGGEYKFQLERLLSRKRLYWLDLLTRNLENDCIFQHIIKVNYMVTCSVLTTLCRGSFSRDIATKLIVGDTITFDKNPRAKLVRSEPTWVV